MDECQLLMSDGGHALYYYIALISTYVTSQVQTPANGAGADINCHPNMFIHAHLTGMFCPPFLFENSFCDFFMRRI